MASMTFDGTVIIRNLLKYLVEGLVVAVAAFFLPGYNLNAEGIIILGLVASATFSMLDMLAPTVASSVRQGSGMGIGAALVGFPGAGLTGPMSFMGIGK
jgi:hypothetical protein